MLLADGMSTPFLRHWYASGALPEAATTKLALNPSSTVALCGCARMVGAMKLSTTLSVAAALVAEPALLLTTTLKRAPWSAATAGGVV